MAGPTKVIAVPRSIRFTEKDGYTLLVRVTEGLGQFVDRLISVRLTGAQIDAIEEWDPNVCWRRELDPIEPLPEPEPKRDSLHSESL